MLPGTLQLLMRGERQVCVVWSSVVKVGWLLALSALVRSVSLPRSGLLVTRLLALWLCLVGRVLLLCYVFRERLR